MKRIRYSYYRSCVNAALHHTDGSLMDSIKSLTISYLIRSKNI